MEVLDVEMVDAEAHNNAVLGVVLGAVAPCRPRTVCKGPSSPRPQSPSAPPPSSPLAHRTLLSSIRTRIEPDEVQVADLDG